MLLVGVAASSTFQNADDVRLAPGERAQVGGYDIQYVRPTASIDFTSNGSLEKINLGADLRVRRDGKVSKRAHGAQLLPLQLGRPRRRVAVLRGRGDERGRAAGRPGPRPVDGRRA